MAEGIQGVYGVSDLIFFYRRPHFILWITAVGAAVNCIAAVALIARYGVNGPALAALLGTAALALLALPLAAPIRLGVALIAGLAITGPCSVSC